MVFDSLWKTFDSRFQAILQSLRKHRDLIDQEASTISIVEAKIWRGQQLEQIRQWRAEQAKHLDQADRQRLSAQTREAVMWFGASQEQDDIFVRLSRACNNSNDHWALREPNILSWLDQSRDNQFLWLHGKPGAGEYLIYPPSSNLSTQSNYPSVFIFPLSSKSPCTDMLTSRQKRHLCQSH